MLRPGHCFLVLLSVFEGVLADSIRLDDKEHLIKQRVSMINTNTTM